MSPRPGVARVGAVAVPWQRLARTLVRAAVREGPRIAREVQRSRRPAAQRPAADRPARPRPAPASTRAPGRHLQYAPQPDGQADPGEVVWTWVAYEDEPAQGKDRPVLVVGRDGGRLLGLMLSSRSTRDGSPDWLALGSGPWDADGRPSWVRLDRVLEVPEDGIRREGAVLDRARFDRVADALRREHGWA